MKTISREYPPILRKLGFKKDVVKLLKTSVITFDTKLENPDLWKVGELKLIAKLLDVDLADVLTGLGIEIRTEKVDTKEMATIVGEYVIQALAKTTFGVNMKKED